MIDMKTTGECGVCGDQHAWFECKEPEAEAIGLGVMGSSNPKAIHSPEERIKLCNVVRERKGNVKLDMDAPNAIKTNVYTEMIKEL